MVGCSMFKAVSVVIQHFYRSVTWEDKEMMIKEAVESVGQEWSPQEAQCLAILSAIHAHWGNICEVKAGATPIFTSLLATWLPVPSEWLPFFQGDGKDQWHKFLQST